MVGDPTPQPEGPGLRIVDRLDGELARGESALEMVEEAPATACANGSDIDGQSPGDGTSGIGPKPTAPSLGRSVCAHSDVNTGRPSTVPVTCACVVARPAAETSTSRSITSSGDGRPMNCVVIHCSGRPVTRSAASIDAAIPEPPYRKPNGVQSSLRARESQTVRIVGRR